MKQLNRRRFLQVSAAATAATSLGRAAGARESAAETVVVGVMGVNGRGKQLATHFQRLANCEVAYLCDPDQHAIGRAVSEVEPLGPKQLRTTGDFRRILDDASVDALVIAAPDHWHAPATILGCKAQKHVYVEKPASHNGHEGQLMVAAARKYRRHVQLGTQRRSSPGVIQAIMQIRAGDIGRVLFARAWINSTRPNIGHGKTAAVPTHLDYDLWQGPAPLRPYRDNLIHYNWHWFWHWGTGELGNNGIHAIDVCRWGLDVGYPTHVTCGGGKLFFDDDQQTPDTQIATFHFGDKVINWEHRTWHLRGFEGSRYGMAFYGEGGCLIVGDSNYTIYDMQGKQVEQHPLERSQAPHFTNFLDAIRRGDSLNAEIETGVASTTLCHLGNIAYRTGSTVHFNPTRRRIIDNPQAEALWRREYRRNWEPTV